MRISCIASASAIVIAFTLAGCGAEQRQQVNLAACYSPTFYHNATPPESAFLPYSGVTKLVYAKPTTDRDMVMDGYAPIGEAFFSASVFAAGADPDDLIRIGQQRGADIVVDQVVSQRESQRTRVVPVYQPGTTTTTQRPGDVMGRSTTQTTTPGTINGQAVSSSERHESRHLTFWRRATPAYAESQRAAIAKASEPTPAAKPSAEERLRQVDDLHAKGLLTDDEHAQRRKAIIEGL